MTTIKRRGPTGRYSAVSRAKSEGATYTPSRLARFVAEKTVSAWTGKWSGPAVRILDPATGDGELLLALVERLRARYPRLPLEIYGFEPNSSARGLAFARLSTAFSDVPVSLASKDFLEHVVGHVSANGQMSFLDAAPDTYDLVIANPPYVRTQVMGAYQAQVLGKQFGLAGRVDLYHAFMLAIARVVNPEGVSGVIVSNRFMTTRSGATVRRAVLEQLDVRAVWDLGDTKLFDAAVLPAVVLAYGRREGRIGSPVRFTSIYETTSSPTHWAPDPIDALSKTGIVEVSDGRRFIVNHGDLETDGRTDGVWRIANEKTEAWLGTVAQHTWGTFRDIGRIRVGVKTCADKVFIRSDWARWPIEERPELLRPVLTHHAARRFKALATAEPELILYPHDTAHGRRTAVSLDRYPRSAAYLESHRGILQKREYLMASGRQWFEIWVPQYPEAWNRSKLVFRDIARDPIFWIDLDGSVVNGDCYWLTPDDPRKADLLWLAVAVGNSSFIQRFYDCRFQNKLYGGRRRFMTQYVEQFPLPNPFCSLGQAIIAKAAEVYACVGTEEAQGLERELDWLVWQAFGLPVEETTR